MSKIVPIKIKPKVFSSSISFTGTNYNAFNDDVWDRATKFFERAMMNEVDKLFSESWGHTWENKTLAGDIKYKQITKKRPAEFFHACGVRKGNYPIRVGSGKCSKCKKYIGTRDKLMLALKMKEFKNGRST